MDSNSMPPTFQEILDHLVTKKKVTMWWQFIFHYLHVNWYTYIILYLN